MPANRVVALPMAVVAAVVAATVLSGCGSAAPRSDAASSSTLPAAVPATIATAATSRAPESASAPAASPAAFSASISAVTTAQLGGSWHAGCPVGASQLRALTLTYWGFDARPHTGVLVVNASVTTAVTTVFHRLYDARFPIRSMRPTADFGGSDPNSMAVDNTSAFNCRLAVTTGPASWSLHAYGEAIDVDTVENPYLETGKPVQPPEGAPYANRADVRPGMAVTGGTLVEAFAAVGWPWGGRWSDPDYQHFSSTGG